jgi:hypothetical protein
MKYRFLLLTNLFALFMLVTTNRSQAQFTPTTTAPYNSPAYLINSVLLGNGVTAFNIQYQGSPMQIGYFTGGNTGGVALGIDSGIVLSTGDVMDLTQPSNINSSTSVQNANNFPADADILSIIQTNNAGGASNDAAIIEFDFTPLGDTVKFDYLFGSEEYPEFVCSFNDGFGMFLSGPGITGPYTNNAANIALVPYTNPPVPVSIYNVNQTTGTCAWANNNDSLYVSNPGASDFPLDGFTKVFTAMSPVQCGGTYHLKIALADANDHSYDSGVILKARSLVSNQVSFIPTSSSGIVGDSSLVEGCTDGYLTFNRPGNLDSTLVVYLTYPNTVPYGALAIAGQDYNQLPDSIVFLPNVPQIIIPVQAIMDGITEPTEGIAISMQFQSGCGGLTQFTRYMYIINPSPVQAVVNDTSICQGDAVTMNAIAVNGYPAFTYLWSTGDTTSSISLIPTQDTTMVTVTIGSTCTGTTDVDTAYVSWIPYNPLTINYTFPTTQLIENCGDTIYLSFDLSTPTTVPLTLNITSTGSATNGTDYGSTGGAFPSSISYAIGDSSITIPLIITPDGLVESTFGETVNIGVGQLNSCSGTTTPVFFSITDFQAASVVIQNPSPVCVNTPVTLQANASGTNQFITGFSYSWSNNPSLLDFADYTFTNNETVTVTVFDTVCGAPYFSSATVNIVVSTPLSIDSLVATKDSVTCPGDPVTLTVFQTGTPQFTYSWANLSSTANNATINPDTTTTYLVLVKDACNQTGVGQTITIFVPEYANIVATFPDTVTNCKGDQVNLIPTLFGGAGNFTYVWDNNPADNSPSLSVTANDSNNVAYNFKAIDMCQDFVSLNINVRHRTYGNISLTAGDDTSACPNARIPIYANIVRNSYPFGYTYNWTCLNAINLSTTSNPIEGSDSIKTHTTINDANADSLMYILTATDICNVAASDTIIVKRKTSCEPKYFNVFSPSSVVNNRFVIDAIEEFPNTSVVIYNRWGVKVFETDNYQNNSPTNSWDAKGVDPGTYYYVVTFKPQPGMTTAREPDVDFVEIIK